MDAYEQKVEEFSIVQSMRLDALSGLQYIRIPKKQVLSPVK